MPLTAQPLDATTWPAFAELVERNNGVFGGCWCMGGYPEGLSRTDPLVNRANKHRRVHEGSARAALVGALAQIGELGGGLVEAISEVTDGRQAQGRFLFSATVELFEQHGFSRGRRLGKHAYLVSRLLTPGSGAAA